MINAMNVRFVDAQSSLLVAGAAFRGCMAWRLDACTSAFHFFGVVDNSFMWEHRIRTQMHF
jgi:hypothetical protein